VYDELRKLAAAKMAQEAPGQTLQATALVHDAYIRLVDVEKAQHWNSRGHFGVDRSCASFRRSRPGNDIPVRCDPTSRSQRVHRRRSQLRKSSHCAVCSNGAKSCRVSGNGVFGSTSSKEETQPT